jgi:diacylglycerol O-acyltransferase / wax synthase
MRTDGAVEARGRSGHDQPGRCDSASDVAALGQTPPMIGALIGRFFAHHSLGMETVVTNIPGPQFPLYALGRKMVACYPYVPVSGRTRLGIAVFSYLGSLHFGVTADADARAHLDACC